MGSSQLVLVSLFVAVIVPGFLYAADSDVCSLPQVVGVCKGLFYRYHFNSATGKCEEFIYGGCGKNANNFITHNDCLAKCKPECTLPARGGRCRAIIWSWFFNTKTGKCEEFAYGGCDGNVNNNSEPSNDDIPNTKTSKCEEFADGGCDGNANNYSSEAECQKACHAVDL